MAADHAMLIERFYVVAPSVLHGYVVNLQVLKVSLTVDVGVV
jgi:hypothetical protein